MEAVGNVAEVEKIFISSEVRCVSANNTKLGVFSVIPSLCLRHGLGHPGRGAPALLGGLVQVIGRKVLPGLGQEVTSLPSIIIHSDGVKRSLKICLH